MKRILVTLLAVLVLVLSQVVPAFAAPTATVTITATPEYLAITISNDPVTWAIGNIAENATVYWTVGNIPPDPTTFEDADMMETLTNTGSITSNIKISAETFVSAGAGDWTISADETPGLDEISLRAGITGTVTEAAMVQVANTPGVELVHALASLGTKKFCMKLLTGTFTDGDAQSGTVTLTISKHV